MHGVIYLYSLQKNTVWWMERCNENDAIMIHVFNAILCEIWKVKLANRCYLFNN